MVTPLLLALKRLVNTKRDGVYLFESIKVLLLNQVNIQQSIDINDDDFLLPYLHTLNDSIHLIPKWYNSNNKTGIITSPLHLAAYLGRVDWIEGLLNKEYKVNIFNYNNTMPLHLAVYAHQNEAAAKLIEHGADITAFSKSYYSIFHIAIGKVYYYPIKFNH